MRIDEFAQQVDGKQREIERAVRVPVSHNASRRYRRARDGVRPFAAVLVVVSERPRAKKEEIDLSGRLPDLLGRWCRNRLDRRAVRRSHRFWNDVPLVRRRYGERLIRRGTATQAREMKRSEGWGPGTPGLGLQWPGEAPPERQRKKWLAFLRIPAIAATLT